MSETPFIPGPYEVRRRWSNGCEVCPEIWAGDEWVATVVGAPHLGFERTLPTAGLLAAAPDLLDALERIAAHADPDSPEENYRADDREGCLDTVFAIARRAIAKATGKETTR